MKKDNKKALMYLGIIFFASLISYKLPHDSYSIIEYFIRPIKFETSVLYIAGIIPLTLYIISIVGIFRLEKFKYNNKLLIFIIIVGIIIPSMDLVLDFSRTSFHSLRNDGLESMDIVESDMHISAIEDKVYISIDLELIDYGKGSNKFKIRLYYPEELAKYSKKEYYDFEGYYYLYGNKDTIPLDQEIEIELEDKRYIDDLFETNWYNQDYKIELYNSEEKVDITIRGEK